MSARFGAPVIVALLIGVAALAVFLVRAALGLVSSMDGAGLLALIAFGFAAAAGGRA